MNMYKVKFEETQEGYKPILDSIEELQECFYDAHSEGREFEGVFIRIFKKNGELSAEFRAEDKEYLSRYSKALKKDVPRNTLERFLEDMEGGSVKPEFNQHSDVWLSASKEELIKELS